MFHIAIVGAFALVAAGLPDDERSRAAQPKPATAPGLSRAAEEAARDQLATHLKAWEEKAATIASVRAEIELTRTDATTRKAARFRGLFLHLKPGSAVLRLDNAADPKREDYEAYIRNGEVMYAYSGATKTVTEFRTGAAGAGDPLERRLARLFRPAVFDHVALELLTAGPGAGARDRFDLALVKTDENYVYLDLKPRTDRDRREFGHLRLALYGPGPNTAKVAYLPAEVYVLRPDGDTEVWKFTNPQANVAGVEPKHFRYVEVTEPGWTHRKADGSADAPERPKP